MILRLRTALFLAALAPVASCAAPPGEAEAAAAVCPLTVRFGSYAMGIDRAALARVEALIAEVDGTSVERRPWGREGELTLCVRRVTPAQATRLFEQISGALPAHPRGPISVATAAGRRFEAPARR